MDSCRLWKRAQVGISWVLRSYGFQVAIFPVGNSDILCASWNPCPMSRKVCSWRRDRESCKIQGGKCFSSKSSTWLTCSCVFFNVDSGQQCPRCCGWDETNSNGLPKSCGEKGMVRALSQGESAPNLAVTGFYCFLIAHIKDGSHSLCSGLL